MKRVGLTDWTEYLISDKTLDMKQRIASKFIKPGFAIRDESIFTTAHLFPFNPFKFCSPITNF